MVIYACLSVFMFLLHVPAKGVKWPPSGVIDVNGCKVLDMTFMELFKQSNLGKTDERKNYSVSRICVSGRLHLIIRHSFEDKKRKVLITEDSYVILYIDIDIGEFVFDEQDTRVFSIKKIKKKKKKY